jgi:hypothetical protein
VTVAETAKLIRELEFAVPTYRKRINIRLQNPEADDLRRNAVAAFYPVDQLIIYSFAEDFDRLRAKAVLEVALRALAERGKESLPTDRRRKAVSFRAYVESQRKVIITKRTRRATLARYRMGTKFSHAFKPKGVKTDEQIVGSVDVA